MRIGHIHPHMPRFVAAFLDIIECGLADPIGFRVLMGEGRRAAEPASGVVDAAVLRSDFPVVRRGVKKGFVAEASQWPSNPQ